MCVKQAEGALHQEGPAAVRPLMGMGVVCVGHVLMLVADGGMLMKMAVFQGRQITAGVYMGVVQVVVTVHMFMEQGRVGMLVGMLFKGGKISS